MPPVNSMLYRIGQTGADEVKQQLNSIGDTGEAVEQRLAQAAARRAADVERFNAAAARSQAELDKIKERQAGFSQSGAAGAQDAENRQRQAAADAAAERQRSIDLARSQIAAEQLLRTYDPLYAAEQRLAQATEILNSEGARLVLTDEQRVLIEQRLREALDQATAAQQRNNGVSGLARSGYQQLGFQVQDFFTQLSGGQRIAVILAQQLPQAAFAITMIGEAAVASGVELTGFRAVAVGMAEFMTGAWGAAILGATLLVAALAPELIHMGAAADDATSATHGLTDAERAASTATQELASRVGDLGNFFDATTGKITETNRTLIQYAILSRQAQIDQANQLVRQRALQALSVAQGAAVQQTGTEFVAERQPSRPTFRIDQDVLNVVQGARSVFDLDRGLQALAQRRPDLTDTIRQVSNLAAQNVMAGRSIANLTKEIDQLRTGSFAPAPPHSGGGGGSGSRGGGAAANDNDPITQAREAIAALQQETAARARVNALIDSGTVSVHQMNDMLADEAKLRPLLALQAHAEGAEQARLTGVIDDYREALEKAHREEAHSQALAAIQATEERIQDARHMLQFVGTDAERALEAARTAADAYADAHNFSEPDREAYRRSQVAAAQVDLDTRAVDQARRIDQEHEDNIQLLQFELSLGARGGAQRDEAIKQEQLRIQLTRELGEGHEAIIADLVRQQAEEDGLRQRIEQQQQAYRELQQFGGNVIDDLLNIDNIDHWGDAWKRVLHDILQEMITLAAINPLKNLLFGSNLPTTSGMGGLFGSIFGGISKTAGAQDVGGSILKTIFSAIPKFADGTDGAPGGLTLYGEEGPELGLVPRGTKIWNAADTRRMLVGGSNAAPSIPINISIDATGASSAELARTNAELRNLQTNLPGLVARYWIDAAQRNVFR